MRFNFRVDFWAYGEKTTLLSKRKAPNRGKLALAKWIFISVNLIF